MDRLIEYKIPYKGISEGGHEYEFHIQDTFFEALECEDIHQADIHIQLKLDKQSRMMILDFEIKGSVELRCDRCLDPFDFPIDIDYQVVVKYGKEDGQNDDILYLEEDEYLLDVSSIIYENILLSIPIKNVHQDDENGNSLCNQEQVELLNNYSKKTTVDPRWDALKNLKFED